MPEKRFNLGKRSRDNLDWTYRTVRAGDGSQRPPPTRRAPRGGRGRGEVLRVQVNQPLGVGSGDATFPFDNAIGQTAPVDGTGTAYNIYQQTYADNDVVWLFWNKELERWETERGGTAGSQLIYFELTQDMAYADAAKLAKPVDETGTLVSGADAFYVVDDQNQFYGKAAAGGAEGYRGLAWLYTDDYTGGVPGWRIITMEGPAQLMVVSLQEDYSFSGTECLPVSDEPWGRPLRGRRVPATGNIEVQDDLEVASEAVEQDKWLIAWDEEDEHYIFVLPLIQTWSRLRWGQATSTISAATGWLVADRGSGTVQFKNNVDGTNDGTPVTVDNPFFDSFLNGSAVCCDVTLIPPLIVSVGCTIAS